MKLRYINSDNNVSFGTRAPSLETLNAYWKIANCKTSHLISEFTGNIAQNPYFKSRYLEESGGILYPKNLTLKTKISDAFYDLCLIPRGLVASFAEMAHEHNIPYLKNLHNLGFVQKHLKHAELKNKVASLRGFYEMGIKEIESADKSPLCKCEHSKPACESVAKQFTDSLNSAMEWGKATYDTKHERFWVRIASGIIGGLFMGQDFEDRALALGKSDEEAKKEFNLKTSQEISANIAEACTQFVAIAVFAKAANTKAWVAALISVGTGFAFNMLSRLWCGMPLTRKDVPQRKEMSASLTVPKMEDFIEQARVGASQTKPQIILKEKIPENKKEPLLSLKNILIVCAASIVAGFALPYAKKKIPHIKVFGRTLKDRFDTSYIGKIINEKIAIVNKKITDIKIKIKENTTREVVITENERDELGRILNKPSIDEKEFFVEIEKRTQELFDAVKPSKEGVKTISLGTEDIRTKGAIEVPIKKLYQLPLQPFIYIKNVISLPYSYAKALGEALGWIKKVIPEDTDPKKIKNIFLKFQELKSKNLKPEDLEKKLNKYIKEIRPVSRNETTISKMDNSTVGVIAYVLGMLSGIYFNMNDDFNRTIENGGTEEQAEKAARLRGINKIARTTVQVIIANNILNSTFAKQYNGSVLQAVLITAVATVATDVVCRILTNMPFSRMTKEEQIEYREKRNSGISGEYFKMIDKLSD